MGSDHWASNDSSHLSLDVEETMGKYLFLCLMLAMALMIDKSESVCCPMTGTCKDGTPSTPCCGYRSCDWFCCACGGGCRKPKSKKRSLDQGDDRALTLAYFKSVDLNLDNRIDFAEALEFKNISIASTDPIPAWFVEMDMDNDGKISPNEFDSDLSD